MTTASFDDFRRRAPAWAKLVGLGPKQWSSAQRLEPGSIEHAPRIGEEYCLSEEHGPPAESPLSVEPGQQFWTMFQPALSLYNGWQSHPEELDRSGLASCISVGRVGLGWPIVRIADLIALADVPLRYPKEHSGEPTGIHKFSRTRFDWNDWSLFDANLEGDAGCWLLCRKSGDAYSALLFGEWGRGSDYFYAGNRVLRHAECQRLQPVKE